YMIEETIKCSRGFARVLGELVGIEQARKPPQTDDPIDGRRPVDPAERCGRRQIYAMLPYGTDTGPERIPKDPIEEVAVPGDDDLWICDDDLFHRCTDQSFLTDCLGDVARAGALDDLGVYGPDYTRLKAIGTARKIYARALVEGYRC